MLCANYLILVVWGKLVMLQVIFLKSNTMKELKLYICTNWFPHKVAWDNSVVLLIILLCAYSLRVVTWGNSAMIYVVLLRSNTKKELS